MYTNNIAKRYATSIMYASKEKGIVEEIKESMEQVTEICRQRDFANFLRSPIIAHLKKSAVLAHLFKTLNFHPLVCQSMVLIARKKRASLIPQIIQAFFDLYDQEKDIIHVSITTTHPVQTSLFTSLIKKYTQQQPVIKTYISPKIIGGFILQIADKRIDTSVYKQLQTIHYIYK